MFSFQSVRVVTPSCVPEPSESAVLFPALLAAVTSIPTAPSLAAVASCTTVSLQVDVTSTAVVSVASLEAFCPLTPLPAVTLLCVMLVLLLLTAAVPRCATRSLGVAAPGGETDGFVLLRSSLSVVALGGVQVVPVIGPVGGRMDPAAVLVLVLVLVAERAASCGGSVGCCSGAVVSAARSSRVSVLAGGEVAAAEGTRLVLTGKTAQGGWQLRCRSTCNPERELDTYWGLWSWR